MFAEILSLLLSLAQIITGFTLGMLHTEMSPIDYGGTTYVEPVVTRWLTLVNEGESDYVIIKGASCSPSELTAANELQKYIQQISGATLEIVDDTARLREHEIIVGKTSRENEGSYTVDREALGDEGFMAKAVGEKLVIAGGELRGTLYGVYDFLERQLGCRWFMPELTEIPSNATIKIDANLNNIQKAHFEYRDDYWNSAFNTDWKVKHKINSDNGGMMPESYGGGISYAGFCHTMNALVPVSHFEEHPEYFSYREDKDAWTLEQRCLTNPEVLAITIANAKATLRANPHAKIISITQNDNGDYCQCPDCKASDGYYGGPSGTNIWFVNQVAEALEAEFPAVGVDTFAYQYTRKPPVNVVPRDNVIVRLCSIECCFAHPLAECGHERNESIALRLRDVESSFAADIKGWSDICDRLYIWDYTTNFNLYLNMFPNFQVLAPNMQFFVENSVKGVFEQGNYTGGKSGEFGEMRAYVLAKLLWDPYCDVERHMTEFMNAYYGKESAPFVKEYLDIITNKMIKTGHLSIFDWHYQGVYFTKAERQRMDRAWDAAQTNAGNPYQLENIRRSRISYRFYKANLCADEFGIFKLSRPAQNKILYKDLAKYGITRLTEHGPYTQDPNFFLTPIEWK
ncbi:MAG: DUF4838 domain-containing protein [Clostridiales bacterium]|nr:DUF4838 domain-containing protein [Clostridiales bacterium]